MKLKPAILREHAEISELLSLVPCNDSRRDATEHRARYLREVAQRALVLADRISPELNPIIGDLDGTLKYGHWPTGAAAAVLTGDLCAMVNAVAGVGLTWKQIDEAVRFVYTHVPTGKVNEWRRKLGKGGAK